MLSAEFLLKGALIGCITSFGVVFRRVKTLFQMVSMSDQFSTTPWLIGYFNLRSPLNFS